MPRKFSCTLGWLAALTVALPATAALAQEPLPQTHTVRKGDTLWDLAQALSQGSLPVARHLPPEHGRGRRSSLDLSRRSAADRSHR